MRVFVTGASGWIGSALVAELLAAGHDVVGLARSDTSAAAVTAAGAQVHRGGLDDLDALHQAAAGSDGVVHTAFKHDIAFTGDFQGAADADQRAIEAMGEALKGSDRPLVIASGLLGLRPGAVATEDFSPDPNSSPRMGTEQRTLALASQGVRSSAVRLSPTVHGDGDHGFMSTLVQIARDRGFSAYLGDGANRWPAVHRLDAAHLFRLALEKAPAGSALHGVSEEGVTTRAIAEAISRGLGLPVRSIAPDDAERHFGWIGALFGMDSPASSAITRDLVAWTPTHQGLIADLDEGHYFSA
ncbi:SDR family oxidoreductase [Allobranchiibius huperziae]|uniref:Nucleoside-diphosphate-sugar epimerase n=1 Tax=Allobranchiibius huperziae TaxID=1874116 RepID=A0A853DBC7_9MICO|nr:SDR family oxidoreductase [Allobranchiibius huperziae]NYJ74248.1 nucleoside-diphosphate-sugar epimerase [Allobranchiibius huperziae]